MKQLSEEINRRSQPVSVNSQPVKQLKGVGPKAQERLKRIGITTVQDVLFHLPYKYEDRTQVSAIGELQPGMQIGVVGYVQTTQIQFGRRRSLVSVIEDGTGRFAIRFFHFNIAQKELLKKGLRIHCFGEIRKGSRLMEMVHPEFRVIAETTNPVTDHRLTPYYPTTEGLHQLSMRKIANEALLALDRNNSLVDYLPTTIAKQLRFPDLQTAIRFCHRPSIGTQLDELEAGMNPAQQRLAFEELLAQHLSLRLRRESGGSQSAPPMFPKGYLVEKFFRSLPFQLTQAQEKVTAQISGDLKRSYPMHRLVQGDVGSGKTVVAALAALQAIEAGYQVAFMAPTELLAEQHLQTFKQWFTPLGLKINWLSGKLPKKTRTATLSAIKANKISFMVGTHALFQDSVTFSKLGLVIVDEQHRFGVHQRLSMLNKGQHNDKHVHQLIMTATPIPRTLAMAAYADLDCSIIDELPPGRRPIETAVIPHTRRREIIKRIETACGNGAQAYWVCTLIDESETLECEAAIDTATTLSSTLDNINVGLIHGRMSAAEKASVMAQFKDGKVGLLVATTVIEVGVDVPNASLMIIENAERLGLAQLHQLRGRIGRGSSKSVCVLMYQSPLSEHAKTRLNALRKTCDGFEIARIDLETRGPGELLGTRQTGLASYRIADLVRDQALLPQVEHVANVMLEKHTTNIQPLVSRWVGEAANYADV